MAKSPQKFFRCPPKIRRPFEAAVRDFADSGVKVDDGEVLRALMLAWTRASDDQRKLWLADLRTMDLGIINSPAQGTGDNGDEMDREKSQAALEAVERLAADGKARIDADRKARTRRKKA